MAATEPQTQHSWHPQSLITLAHDPPAPPTIGGLLYPGKRTLLSGETESLKTWLALILTKAELEIGKPVAWVDLDDMGAGALLQRLRALDVPDEQTHDLFLYYTPDQRLYDTRTGRRVDAFQDVLLQLLDHQPRMMVIDAFNPMLTLHGLNPDSVTEIETFWREIADPIAKTGAAPVLLDHVVKNADNRGKYATGSERKASGCTVHIGTRTIQALTVGGNGSATLTTHKDRPAYLPRPTIGILELASNPNGDRETIQYKMEADLAHAGGKWRPTILMERISKTLDAINEPQSQTWVEKNVEGDATALRKALTALVETGHIQRTTGPRNTLLHTLVKPYSQYDDPTPADPVATPLHPVPELVSTDPVAPFPLLRRERAPTGVGPEANGVNAVNPNQWM